MASLPKCPLCLQHQQLYLTTQEHYNQQCLQHTQFISQHEKEVQELKNKLQEISTLQKETNHDNEKAESVIRKQTQEISTLQKEIKNLKAENQRIKKTALSKPSDYDSIKTTLEIAKKANFELQQSRDQIQTEYNELSVSSAEKDNIIAKLNDRIKLLEKKLNASKKSAQKEEEMMAQIIKAKNQHDVQFNELNKKFAEELAALQEQLKSRNEENKKFVQEIKSCKNQNNQLKQSLNVRQTELTTQTELMNQLAETEKTNKLLQEQIKNLQEQQVQKTTSSSSSSSQPLSLSTQTDSCSRCNELALENKQYLEQITYLCRNTTISEPETPKQSISSDDPCPNIQVFHSFLQSETNFTNEHLEPHDLIRSIPRLKERLIEEMNSPRPWMPDSGVNLSQLSNQHFLEKSFSTIWSILDANNREILKHSLSSQLREYFINKQHLSHLDFIGMCQNFVTLISLLMTNLLATMFFRTKISSLATLYTSFQPKTNGLSNEAELKSCITRLVINLVQKIDSDLRIKVAYEQQEEWKQLIFFHVYGPEPGKCTPRTGDVVVEMKDAVGEIHQYRLILFNEKSKFVAPGMSTKNGFKHRK